MTSARIVSPSLAYDINESIREIHANLNRTILTLLPRALPPHSDCADVYANGMSCILPIYEAIESSLRQAREASPGNNRQRCAEAVAALSMTELSRGSRLKQDLTAILTHERATDNPGAGLTENRGSAKLPNQHSDALPAHSSAQHPRLFALTSRIKGSARVSPHLLFAYTHVFYLAIFSGGRYIRARLRDVSISHPHFFPPSQSAGSHVGGHRDDLLTFWTFEPCTNDGEDLKATFKRRFNDAEVYLTPKEKDEVISEAQWAMRTLEGLIADVARSLGKELDLPVTKSAAPLSMDLVAPPVITQKMGRRSFVLKELFHAGLPEFMLAVAAGVWGIYRYSSGAALADSIRVD